VQVFIQETATQVAATCSKRQEHFRLEMQQTKAQHNQKDMQHHAGAEDK
jgi:hypothetical protein